MALKKSNGSDVEKLLDQLDEEEAPELSEISVDEDGFVRDVPLLAGYVDPDTGIRHTTFSYREMTGRDEEAINKAEVRQNGGKLINVLLERCVTEIGTLTKKELGTKKWGEVIRSMYSGDLDYMAFKIRELSKGKEIEFVHTCPECKSKLTTVVNTDEFSVIPFNGLDKIEFTLPRGYKDKKGNVHRDGTLRLLNGYDREIVVPLFKKNGSTATTLMMTRLMKFNDGTPIFSDNIADLSLRDRDYIEKLIQENNFGLDMSVEINCPNCGADISGEIGQSNFF